LLIFYISKEKKGLRFGSKLSEGFVRYIYEAKLRISFDI